MSKLECLELFSGQAKIVKNIGRLRDKVKTGAITIYTNKLINAHQLFFIAP